MRSHAKASTAGSTQRQAFGLGRIFRGALATGAAEDGAGGRSASAPPRARRAAAPHRTLLGTAGPAALSAVVLLLLLAAPASAGTASGRQFLFSFDGRGDQK